jgi:hypothetical protein
MDKECVCGGTGTCQCPTPKVEQVNHPSHYQFGNDRTYEVIKIIEVYDFDFHIGNCFKYISRAGKKDPTKELEDLKKARFYLDRKIQNIEKNNGN